MSLTEDRVILPPSDAALALAPHRVISAERVALARAHRRAEKAGRKLERLVGERDIDQRLLAAQAESIRRWAALHAATEARLRRWQLGWAVTFVLALGYVLVYTAAR